MTSNERQVREKTEEVIERAKEIFPTVAVALNRVDIRFDIGGYRKAGEAGWKLGRFFVRYHPTAVEEYLDHMLHEVVPHEVAHIVCAADPTLGRNHNQGWKRVCMKLGGVPSRCHSLDLGGPSEEEQQVKWAARRPYIYTDSAGVDHRVTKQMHRKIQVCGYSYRFKKTRGLVNAASTYRYSPVNGLPKASKRKKTAQKKTVRKQNRTRAKTPTGGKTKAQICREWIRDMYGKVHEDIIIDKIAFEASLSRSLAKKYFQNNLEKALQ